MPPLHVVMLCLTDDPFDPPGWERFGGGHLFVFDLGRYLVRLGCRVDFVTRRNAPAKLAFEDLGPLCRVTRVDVGPPEDVAALGLYLYVDDLVRAVAAVECMQRVPDVIHSHNWLSGSVARRIFASAPPTRHIHSILSLGRVRLALGEEATAGDAVRDALEVEVFRNADALVTVTASERAALRQLYPEVAHDRIAVVPYGIDPEIFNPRPESPDDFLHRTTGRSSEGAL